MTYPVDLEADFRPSPVDPNWLTSSPVTTEAVPYGGQGRSQPTYSTEYGAEATGTVGEQKGKGMRLSILTQRAQIGYTTIRQTVPTGLLGQLR